MKKFLESEGFVPFCLGIAIGLIIGSLLFGSPIPEQRVHARLRIGNVPDTVVMYITDTLPCIDSSVVKERLRSSDTAIAQRWAAYLNEKMIPGTEANSKFESQELLTDTFGDISRVGALAKIIVEDYQIRPIN